MLFSIASETLTLFDAGDIHGNPSLLKCYNGGHFCPVKYMRDKRNALWNELEESELELQRSCTSVDIPETKKKRQKRIILTHLLENGTLEEIPPTDSLWYNLYISCPQTEDNRFLQKFRRRFRLPYHKFLELVEEARLENWFPRWTRLHPKNNLPPSPLELLI